ncbi:MULTISPECIES: hypothetical protein [Halostella]|uniref:hypothetical protein n=1 Tax=Halostella TaxID=1843185 RepID=UPI0010816E03|nr:MULTISPECIES: hypothetical protein [Halostella]
MSGIDPNDIQIDWYTNGSEDQVAVGIEADDVKIAVTFPVSASRSELETVLAERDRELDHYFEALARVRDSAGQSKFNSHRR